MGIGQRRGGEGWVHTPAPSSVRGIEVQGQAWMLGTAAAAAAAACLTLPPRAAAAASCSVDWSPDGGSVASGGKDKVLKLWRR